MACVRVLSLAWACAVLSSSPGAAGAETLSLPVGPEGSQVRIHLGRAGFLGFLGHEHTIEAPVAEGQIEADSGDLRYSRVRLRFEAARLAVVPGTEPEKDVPEVEKRMRGPDVLDVAAYPAIAFRSTAVAGEAEGGGVYRIRLWGVLELKGAAHEIFLPLEVRQDGGRITASGQVELRLRALGIEPPDVAGVVKVADRFRVSFEIQAGPERVDASRPE